MISINRSLEVIDNYQLNIKIFLLKAQCVYCNWKMHCYQRHYDVKELEDIKK